MRDVIKKGLSCQIKRPWFSKFISTLWEEVPKKIDFIVGLANMDFNLVFNSVLKLEAEEVEMMSILFSK